MTKVTPILLAAVLALGALAAAPSAQAATDGQVSFVDLGHHPLKDSNGLTPVGDALDFDQDNVPELLGSGAVGVVRLVDPDIESLATATVLVTSGSDSSGETITLYNDPTQAGGNFFGTFGVEATAVAGNGLVQVAKDGQFFIKYTDTSGPISSGGGNLEWRPAADGAISIAGDLFGSNLVTVTVTDPDSNARSSVADDLCSKPTGACVPLGRAYSPKSPKGIDLSFHETGANTGDFTATLNLNPSTTPDAAKLMVADGDQVTVLFTDPTSTEAVSTFGGLGDKLASIRIEDPDLIGIATVNAVVKSSQDPIGLVVPLTATGSNTGEFTGQFGFTDGDTGSNKLHVAPGSTLTAQYTDAKNANGVQPNPLPSATATWLGIAPTIRFTDGSFNNDVASADVTVPPHLVVRAPTYSGQGSVPVLVTSEKDPLGILVTLAETAAGSGVFRDAASATWGSTTQSQAFGYATRLGGPGSQRETGNGNGKMLVRDGDKLTATFLDQRGSGAKVTDTLTVNDAADTTPQPSKAKGTIALMLCKSSCDTDNPTLENAPAAGFYGNRADSIFVQFKDPNFPGASPTAKDPVTVHVGSFNLDHQNDSPLQWKPDGSGLDGGIAITLTETEINSKVFVGKFGTSTATSPGAGLLKVGGPGILNTIGVAYAYEEHPWNTEAYTPTPTSQPPCEDGSSPDIATQKCPLNDQVGKGVSYITAFHTSTTNAALDFRDNLREGASITPANPFVGLGNGFIALTGVDPVEDTSNAANTVKVRVRSTSDSTGFDVTLTERYAHAAGGLHLGPAGDNAFVGQFGFTDGASSASGLKLKVADGDTVVVSYNDPHDATGGAASVSDTATWKPGATGTLAVPVFIRVGDDGKVQVKDADRNTDGSAQTVTVQVIPQRSVETPFDLTLTETGGNTGIFEGPLPVQTTCLSDQKACVVSGDRVTVRYVDPRSASGSPAVVEASLVGLDSNGGLLALDHPGYSTTGATAIVALEDPDLGTSDSVQEEVDVRVFSDTDGEGEKVTLKEDGLDSHLFTGTFGFESSRAEGNGKVHVAEGDRVTAYYFDDDTGAVDDVAVFATAVWTSTASSKPTATLTATPASGPAPLDVTFTLAGSDPDGAVASYTLSFGDGTATQTGTGVPPTSQAHTYATDGSYTARLTVTDNGGLVGYSNVTITVGTVPPPALSAVSPSQGLPAGGTPVTLTGTGFASGATVTFGGVAATDVVVVSPTQITAKTPAHDAGTVDVVVTVGAQLATKAAGFTYTNTPTTTTTPPGTTSSSSSSSGGGTNGGTGGAPTAAQVLAANQKVKVTVTHEDGKNTIKFDLPDSGLPGTVLGVQIWRSNSPYTLVATLPSSDPDFKDGSYVDSDAANAKETTKYLVTMYYGATSAFGLFTPATAPDTAQYRGASAADSSGGSDGGGLPSWAIVLIVVGILFLVVLVAILIARGRNREQQGAAQGYAWQESTETEAKAAEGEWQPPAEVHQARCPSCGTSFTAAGTKPIVTVCPGCGKKGILR
jgi:hypothetical protein